MAGAGRRSWTVGVGLCAGDHGRVEVEAGDIEPVVVGQPGRQVAGPATNLEDPRAVGGNRCGVGGDAFDERAEQEPAQGVVDDGIADEDAARRPVSSGGAAAVSQDGDGLSGPSGQDHQLPTSSHHASTRYPRALARHGISYRGGFCYRRVNASCLRYSR
jgi:hypothetical protein